MSIFTTKAPRHFERTPYFTDPRKEALEQRVRRIKRELGKLDESELKPDETIRGSFVEGTTHLKRRKESSNPSASSRNRKILIWLVVLGIVLYFLFQ